MKVGRSMNLEDRGSFVGRELGGFEDFDRKMMLGGEGRDYRKMGMEWSRGREVMEDEKEGKLAELDKVEKDVGKKGGKERDRWTGKGKGV